MYSPKVIESRLQTVQQKLKRELRHYSVDKTDEWKEHLTALYNPDTKQLVRELKKQEREFIENEQILFQFDFRYAAEHYFKVMHWSNKGLVTPQLSIAQNIMLDVLADHEERGAALQLQLLKARQLFMTTFWVMVGTHRFLTIPRLYGLVASSDPDKTTNMLDMIRIIIEELPWYLKPEVIPHAAGEKAFQTPQLGGIITRQHGTQKKEDIGRSQMVSFYLLTEVAGYSNPAKSIESSLLKTIHPSPNTIGIEESTAEGEDDWWHDRWLDNQKHYPEASDIRPIFLPWPVGSDIYPTPTWAKERAAEIANFKPNEHVLNHAKIAAEFLTTNPLLKKYYPLDWQMPIAQQYYYHFEYQKAKRKKTLSLFLQEMPCLVGETLISTEQGILPIAEAAKARSVETGEITDWIERGEKEVFTLATERGREIVGTENHRIAMVSGEWKEIKDLVAGDKIKLSPPKFAETYCKVEWDWTPASKLSITIDEDWGRFLGYFMGDGCFSTMDTVEFMLDAKDQDAVDDLCALLERITGRKPAAKQRGGEIKIRSYDTHWKEILYNLGAAQIRWHTSENRTSGFKRKVCVPPSIFKSPKSVIRAFLSALYECDGHAYKDSPRVHFFSCHPEFVRDIQLLLLGFGINTIIGVSNKKRANMPAYIGRELRISAAAANLFYDEINFISHRKRSGKRRTDQMRGTPIHPNTMDDTVKSIIPSGSALVYDINVRSAHCFGANGILTHNCRDVDCFQAPHQSIFDAELIMTKHDQVMKPEAVYSIVSDDPNEIPEKFKFSPLEHDRRYNQQKLTVGWTNYDKPRKYSLIPLVFQTYETFKPDGKLMIWEFPKDNEEYAIGIDCSFGLGADYSVIEVVRKGTFQEKEAQVAEFFTPWMNAEDLIPFAMVIGTMYATFRRGKKRQPKVVIEIMAAAGETLQRAMQKLGWHEFHHRQYEDHVNLGPTSNLIGWSTDERTRKKVISLLISTVRDHEVDIRSRYLVNSIANLQRNEDTGKIAAFGGRHDDHAIAFGIVEASLSMDIMPGAKENQHRKRKEVEGRKAKLPERQLTSQETAPRKGDPIWKSTIQMAKGKMRSKTERYLGNP